MADHDQSAPHPDEEKASMSATKALGHESSTDHPESSMKLHASFLFVVVSACASYVCMHFRQQWIVLHLFLRSWHLFDSTLRDAACET